MFSAIVCKANCISYTTQNFPTALQLYVLPKQNKVSTVSQEQKED